ncbi:uncharacterized protein LOC123268118 [Cotesia glomerata]|uniref:uncharacterized protein LOC123268118 n=1 Tax=Cotesia glomerata TaxID=32391 RepID=UPI001D0067B2|nr:uncharacterized protein LOC123268118 [Cotesia glomerata]
MILLYADDTSIFAHSHVDLARKLKALHEYCLINGLEVNRSKTNIMIYKSAGRARLIPENFRTYGLPLDTVSKTNFLGVKISSSTLGLAALDSALIKAKCASSTVISILSKAKCDSWDAYNKLFESLVASVLLYAFPAWGLRYRNSLETAQCFFYKKQLRLPRNTAD